MVTPPLDLDLVRRPRDYQPESFVARKTELKTIREKVRQAQTENMIVEPVINFWGVGGIGKTWLLRHLEHTYNYLTEPTAEPSFLEPRPTFSLYYTFVDDPTKISLSTLTKSLASQTFSQLSERLSEEDRDILVQAGNTGNIKTLANILKKLSRDFVPLILLDNTEKIESADWAELEQELVEPLVSSNRVLVVIAGRRRAPRWKRFEVRRRAMEPDKTRIHAFSKDQVSKQIEQQGYRIPADLLFSYTAGNPHLVDAIARNIRDWTNGKEPDSIWFDQHQDDLLLPILQAYEEHLLEDLPKRLREVLQAVSPLRAYRLEALRFMLTNRKIKVEPQPDSYYLSLLRDLEQQTEVVWWSQSRRAYKTDGMVRRVMNRKLLLQDEKAYTWRHRQAIKMYWNWAETYSGASEDFIIEIWFHQASIYLADNSQSILQDETKRALYFAQDNLTSDRLFVLHKQLEGDLELIDLLPNDLHQTLKELLTPEYNP
jgi:hypothetical protein